MMKLKKLKFTLLAVLTILSVSAFSQNKTKKNMEMKHILVVYFSATGTTKQVAERLATIANADLCEIVPVRSYTSADLNWNDNQSRSSIEMNDAQARPEVKDIDVDLTKYDCIFLGYPIWWNLAPRVINTFIERNDLTGKTVIPFATSGSSSITGSVVALKKSYPKINWQTGKLLNHASELDMKAWYNKLGISAL